MLAHEGDVLDRCIDGVTASLSEHHPEHGRNIAIDGSEMRRAMPPRGIGVGVALALRAVLGEKALAVRVGGRVLVHVGTA